MLVALPPEAQEVSALLLLLALHLPCLYLRLHLLKVCSLAMQLFSITCIAQPCSPAMQAASSTILLYLPGGNPCCSIGFLTYCNTTLFISRIYLLSAADSHINPPSNCNLTTLHFQLWRQARLKAAAKLIYLYEIVGVPLDRIIAELGRLEAEVRSQKGNY